MKRNAFVAYVVDDLLSGLKGVTAKAMFGGYGLYCDGIFFGIIDDETLYFKVDETTRKKYEAAGSKPFSYEAKSGRKTIKSYYQVPVDVLESHSNAVKWAAESVQIPKSRGARRVK